MDSQHKADVLNNQFVSVFTSEDQSPLPHITYKSIPDINHKDGVFDHLTLIKQLVLDCGRNSLSNGPTTHLYFQSSLDQGQLPNDWKSANITPIYKRGNRTDPENYQPITSICCKILEHIIYPFISTHWSNYNILNSSPWHRSILHETCNYWKLSMTFTVYSVNTRSHIDALFVDLYQSIRWSFPQKIKL